MLKPLQAKVLKQRLAQDNLRGNLSPQNELRVEKFAGRHHPDLEFVFKQAKEHGFKTKLTSTGLALELNGVHVMTAETRTTPDRILVERFIVHGVPPRKQFEKIKKIAGFIGTHFGDIACRPYRETLKEAAQTRP